MTDVESARSRSLVALISDLPRLIVELLKAELAHLRGELQVKAKHAGLGVGLLAAAATLLFAAFAVLVAAAILGLSLVLPAWLAALIVFVVLLIVAGILALIAVSSFKRMQGVAPSQTITSIKEDSEAIKGMGRYDD
ncbi:MAG TPA: phage holin family protein [Leifsonia sp.]